MSKILVSLLFIGTLCSCGTGSSGLTEDITEQIEGKGGRYYGGVLRINESEYIKNLFPHTITDVYSYRVAAQIYEGLFKFDARDLSVINNLAESHDIDSSGTIYTFRLKKGVYFHDDPAFPTGKGREVTAKDVIYCFTQLCTPHPNNHAFSVFKDIVKGANEHYQNYTKNNKKRGAVQGIKALDKYTVEITLTRPYPMFITNLARPACFIYPKEAQDAYGLEMRTKAVGTGPFFMDELDEDVNIILKRNENYHGKDEYGNKLPFLEAVSIHFIKEKKTEFLQFKKGNLDMVYRMPSAFINDILEETDPSKRIQEQIQLQRSPEMVTQFLAFNNENTLFKDKNLRKAFNYAIDREKILEFVLKGEGYGPGIHGITPPVFPDYDIRKIPGYYLHVDSAKYYLSKAGYPNGENFPGLTLYLNAEGERNTSVAVEIQKQLYDHLNIKIKLTTLPFAQLLEMGYKGDYDMLRTAWYADFPSVENFLWLFSASADNNSVDAHPNIMRFQNEAFNQKYREATQAKTREAANRLFLEAEQILMAEAPILVLWYDEGYRLLQYYIKNFPTNPMQYRDYSEVFFQGNKKIAG